MSYIYVAPMLSCRECTASILLPYPRLPLITEDQWSAGEFEGPMDTVPETWSVLLGCRECGHVEVYPWWHVGESIVQKETQGVFHSDANCFSVRLQCAKISCKSPGTLHVNLRDRENEKDLLKLLKSGFFDGKPPCGHPIMPIPDRYYVDPRRVMTCLWSVDTRALL